MGARWIRREWIGRGRRGTAAVVAVALLACAVPGPAAAAGGSLPLPMADVAKPSANPELAQRQALGCTLVGLGVTGVAVASGALASAGSGGSGAVAVSAVLGEIATFFGAGCTIGAFLAGLFPVSQPATAPVGRPVGVPIRDDIGG